MSDFCFSYTITQFLTIAVVFRLLTTRLEVNLYMFISLHYYSVKGLIFKDKIVFFSEVCFKMK